MKRLDQPKLEGTSQGWHVPAGNRTRASWVVGGEHFRKDQFEQLVYVYLEHLHKSARQVENARESTILWMHPHFLLKYFFVFYFILFYFKVLQCSYRCSYLLAAYIPELECVQPEAEHEEIGATRHGTPRAGINHRFYCFLTCSNQRCGSGIRCFFDPWIRDPRQVFPEYRNLDLGPRIPYFRQLSSNVLG